MAEQNAIFITSGILLFSMLLLIFLERKFPYRKGLPFLREGLWVDFIWYSVFQNYVLQIVIFDCIITPLKRNLNISGFKVIGEWPWLGQLLFFLLVHDFYIYWFHRWQHNSTFLWRTHEAHHSNKAVDWIAGSRSHAFEIIINQTVEFAPMVLLGVNPVLIPVKACIDGIWGMYIHSNIDVRSGPLQYILNGPEMHLWHHADQNEVFFANFATKFAFWDWIFGTAYLPSGKPQRYGLYYKYPKSYLFQFLRFFKRIDESIFLKSASYRKSVVLIIRTGRYLRRRLQVLIPSKSRKPI